MVTWKPCSIVLASHFVKLSSWLWRFIKKSAALHAKSLNELCTEKAGKVQDNPNLEDNLCLGFKLWHSSKNNYFCATNISVQKFCSNQMGQKPTKKFEIWPQKGKTVVNCAFLLSKNQILRNLWKILRDRTVARSHLLETRLGRRTRSHH